MKMRYPEIRHRERHNSALLVQKGMSSRNYRSINMTLISRKIIKYYSED